MNFDWKFTATSIEPRALWVTFNEGSGSAFNRRCGEIYQRRPRNDWTYVLSLNIAPPDFVVDPVPRFATEQEAKDALLNISTVLLIGGHHERK